MNSLSFLRFIYERRWFFAVIGGIIILGGVNYYFWRNQSTVTLTHFIFTYIIVVINLVLGLLIWPRTRVFAYLMLGLTFYLQIMEIYGVKVISGLI